MNSVHSHKNVCANGKIHRAIITVRPGCETLTTWGWGVVAECGKDNTIKVNLEWGASLYTRKEELLSVSFPIGTCVDTKYGTGIILDYLRSKDFYIIRMWQADGSKGAAMAYMPSSDVLNDIEAAVGLQVMTPLGIMGRVLHYRRSDHMYIVQLAFANAFIHGSHIRCTTSKFVPSAYYLVWLASNNISSYKGPLLYLVDILRKFRSGVVPMDISFEGVIKLLMSSGANSSFLTSQRSKLIACMKSARERMIELAKSRGFEFDLDLRKVIDKANFKETVQILGNDTTLFDDALVRMDTIINSLSALGNSGEECHSLSEGNSESVSDTDGMSQKCESVKETDSSDFLNFMKLYLGDRNFTGDTFSVFMSFFKGDLELQLRSIGFLSTDPVFEEMMMTIRNLSSVWLKTLNDLQAAVQAIMHVISASKTILILKQGGNNLRNRILNLVNESVPTGVIIEKTKEFIGALPSVCDQKMNSDAMMRIKSRLNSKLYSDDMTALSSLLDSLLAKLLSNWGELRKGGYSAFKSNHIIFISLLQSFENYAHSTLSQTWRVEAEARLCSILEGIQDHETLSSFEIRKKILNPLHGALSLSINGVCNAVNLDSTWGSLERDPLSLLSKMLDLQEIRSTDLTINGALELSKNILDGDVLEGAARKLVDAGEALVTSMETLRSNGAVQEAISRLACGDLGASVMSTVSNFEVDSVFSIAENVICDADARYNLLSKVKDQVLEFLLQYIPTLPLPDLDGVKDDIEYSIMGLDLSRFRFTKENVFVEIGRNDDLKNGDEILTFRAKGIQAKFLGLRWRFAQTYFPHLKGDGLADAEVNNAEICIGFKIVLLPKGFTSWLAGFPLGKERYDAVRTAYPQIASILDKEASTLQSSGNSNSSIPDDESSKRHETPTEDWEPALILSTCSITIENLTLVTENNSFSWLFNILATVFSNVIKDYVSSCLKDIILSSSGSLLDIMNATIGNQWPLIRRVLSFPTDFVQISKPTDLIALLGPIPETVCNDWDFHLKYTDSDSLGLQLDVQKQQSQQTNSFEYFLVVSGIVSGSQTEQLLRKLKLDPRHVLGAVVRSINGKILTSSQPEESLALLRGPRPLTVSIRLSQKGHDLRVLSRDEAPPAMLRNKIQMTKGTLRRPLRAVRVLFNEGPLGLKLKDNNSVRCTNMRIKIF